VILACFIVLTENSAAITEENTKNFN